MKPNKTQRWAANNMAWTLSGINVHQLIYDATMDLVIKQRKEAIEKMIAEQQKKPVIIQAKF